MERQKGHWQKVTRRPGQLLESLVLLASVQRQGHQKCKRQLPRPQCPWQAYEHRDCAVRAEAAPLDGKGVLSMSTSRTRVENQIWQRWRCRQCWPYYQKVTCCVGPPKACS